MIHKIIPIITILIAAIVAFGQTTYALSAEQKNLFDRGVYQFDIEAHSGGACGSVSISLSGNSNAAKAFNFLVGQGLTDYQAAGVVGNLQAESSIIPNRKQGTGMQTIQSIDEVVPNVGFGIAQWTTAGRQTAWKNFAKEKSMNPLSLELQLLYLWHELESDPFFGLEHLLDAKDLQQATWIFLAFFERPSTVIDAGKAGDPAQPVDGGAKTTLSERVALATQVTEGEPSTRTRTATESTDCETAANGIRLRIGTFNIFHIDNNESVESWSARLKKSVHTITSNNLDVVGLQEARPDQQKMLQTEGYLKGAYGIYPNNAISDFTPNPIVYDSSRWEIVDSKSKRFDIKYGRAGLIRHGTQVRLRENGCTSHCAELYVLNTHDPAMAVGGSAAQRNDNSQTYVEKVEELAKDNIPILLTGDFNSQYNDEAHCIISKSGIIKDTWEIHKDISGCANSREIGTAIDRIYASKEVTVNKYWAANRGKTGNGNGSDVHDTIMNELQFGGESGGATSVNGYTFPLKASRATIINAKPSNWCFSSANNCHHDYNAADIFAPTGTPVLAARGGRVVTAKDNATNPSAVGTRVTIMGDDGFLYYYAHMGNNTLSVRSGQTVTAGEELAKIGTSANAVGTQPHLHIDRLPGNKYTSRPYCSGAACNGYPFDNIQELMSKIFKEVE